MNRPFSFGCLLVVNWLLIIPGQVGELGSYLPEIDIMLVLMFDKVYVYSICLYINFLVYWCDNIFLSISGSQG